MVSSDAQAPIRVIAVTSNPDQRQVAAYTSCSAPLFFDNRSRLKCVVPGSELTQSFYLIVTDHDRGVFAVEDPMTDDRPWKEADTFARNNQHRIMCGPTGADRDALVAEFRGAHNNLAGVPTGSILRSIRWPTSSPP